MLYADVNKDKVEFIERFKKYILPRSGARGGEKLLAYLLKKTDFFTAPASKKHHMATQGGLCRHSLNVDDALCELMLTPNSLWNQYAIDHNITRDKIATVALLHDICKVNFYVDGFKNQKTYDPNKVAAADPRNVKKDGQGAFIWETVPSYDIDDKFPIGHGEKSIFMISQYIDLTLDEIMAIRWHMGFTVPQQEWGTLNSAMDCSPFIIAVHMADLTATHLMEIEESGYEAKGIIHDSPDVSKYDDESEDSFDSPAHNDLTDEALATEAAAQMEAPAENVDDFNFSDADFEAFANMANS